MPMAIPLIGAAFMAVGAVASTIGLGIAFTIGTMAVSWGALATIAGLALMAVSMLTMKIPKPGSQGNQLDTKKDPKAPIPIIYGRTCAGGTLVYQESSGHKNLYVHMAIVLSMAGPVQNIEPAFANDVQMTFAGNPNTAAVVCTGTTPTAKKLYQSNKLYMRHLLGETGPAAVGYNASMGAFGNMPGAPGKASGAATVIYRAEYDKDNWPQGLPKMKWVVSGVKVYDPRKDSTYPGGSGTHRLDNSATWQFSENPFLCALHWTLGKWENGHKVCGIGAKPSEVDIAAFVRGANVADVNGWKVGGNVSTGDDKFAVLATILQAGGGLPIARGAQISCTVNAPRVSLMTITREDVIGEIEIQNTSAHRDRHNTVVPAYREETQLWNIIQGQPITSPVYVIEDNGEPKTREVEYPMVQNATQAHQLGAYELVNSRESLTFTMKTKVRCMNLLIGDMVLIDLPEIAANGVKCQVINRDLNPADITTTLTFKTETDGKHAFALGQSQTAPASPALTPFDVSDMDAPTEAAWDVDGDTIVASNGSAFPVIRVVGANSSPYTESIIIEYRPTGGSSWIQEGIYPKDTLSIEVTDVTAGQQYDVAISYRSVHGATSDRTIYTATAGQQIIDWSDVSGAPSYLLSTGAWTSPRLYTVGELFTRSGITYIVNVEHTSSAGSPPPNANVSVFASDTVTAYLTNETISLPASARGVVSSFTGATGALKVIQGKVDVSSSYTFSKLSETNLTSSINATTGVFTVTAMPTSATSGTATYRASGDGFYLDKVFTVTKAKAGAATHGLTPNSSFDAEKEGWFADATMAAVTTATFNESYNAAPYVLSNPVGVRADIVGGVVSIDPARKFKIRGLVHSSGGSGTISLGVICKDAAGAVIGTAGGVVYATGWNSATKTPSGWFVIDTPAITGESTSNNSDGALGFRTGTRQVQIFAYLNQNANGSQVFGLDRLFLEDITESTAAASSATAAETARTNAANEATAAAASALGAGNFATTADAHRIAADTARTAAQTAKTAAEAAQSASEAAKVLAQAAQTAASTSATNAATSATNAGTSATNSEAAKIAAQSAQTASETARTQAQTAATNAAGSATAASGSATTAGTHATNAGNSATAASASATSASIKANGRGLTPNAEFIDGVTGWTNSLTQVASYATASTYTPATNWNGAANVVLNSTNGLLNMRGTVVPYVVGRKYRLRGRIRATATSTQHLLYVIAFDAAGATTYTSNVLNLNAANADWYVIDQLISSATFDPIAVQIAPGIRTNNTSVAATVGVDYLYIEDVTESEAAGALASAASTSATAAAASQTAAGNSASAANTSAINAASSATTAGTNATNAGNSATAAANSATTASTQATNAGNSASAANTSAISASSSASTAGTSATNAGTAATNAGNSATAAANSATTAGTSATNAGNSATAANTSAINAASSAGAASGSATAAAGSATTAGTHATNAGNSATSASTSAVTASVKAASKGLTSNADLALGVSGWTATVGVSTADASVTPLTPLTSYQGASYVLQNPGTGTAQTMRGNVVSVQAGRKYRVRARYYNTVSGTRIDIGVALFNAAGVYQTFERQVISSTTVDTWIDFNVLLTTVGSYSMMAPYAALNNNGTAAAIVSVDYLYIEDVTESEAAGASATAAATSASAASTSATNAGTSASAAQTSATNASTAAGNASTSATNAANSATGASGSASTASTQATNAANSATAAGNSATAAAGSASTASTQATNAGNSATSASGSANTATTKASEASSSATAAATSASNASASQTAAGNSATSASGSANTATTKASEASTSASAAASSASAASASETAAGNSATSASSSATSASTSAGTATTQATNASNSATTAGTHATNASTSASAAATSATNAGNSATAANTSATNAGTSATNAGNSATAANTSATNAASSFTSTNLARAMLLPDRYETGAGQFFTAAFTGDPSAVADAASNATASGYGPVRSIALTGAQTGSLATRGVVAAVAGRTYQVTVELERTATSGSGTAPTFQIGLRSLTSAYADVGTQALSTGQTFTGSVQTFTQKFSSAAASGVLAWGASAVWLRPYAYVTCSSGLNITVQIRRITFTDVTEVEATTASAAAAASSASAASTSATNAGTSATSASTSANTATTKAGEASTSATNASNSASAASTSASDASSSQTAAGNSATAAAGSATAASTSAGNASTYASNASTSATGAAGWATTATTQAGLAATSATNAGNSATAAATSASGASGSAAAASTSASTAQSWALLSASIGGAYLNKNTGFDDYANATTGTRPTGWDTGATGLGSGYRVADNLGGYAWRVPAAAATAVAAGISHSGDNLIQSNGYYVIEADVILNSGALTGAGVLFRTTTSGGTTQQDLSLIFSSSLDQTGTVPGAGTTGKNYQFRKLVKCTTGAPTGFILYAMNHESTFGSIAGANDLTWLKVALRPATQAEIRDSTVLAPLEATVSTLSSTVATHDTRVATYLNRVSAGSGTAEIELKALDSGGAAASSITLKADKIKLGGITTPALEIVSGVSTFNGELNVGGTSGARTNIQKDVIKVYDASSVLRVKIGNLSL